MTVQEFESFINGSSASSYAGRILARRNMEALSQKVAYNHAYRPTNALGLSQFLRLKQEDSKYNVTTSPAYSASSTGDSTNWASKVMDEESAKLLQELESQAATQFIQNFYNSYMSPANSDICYRLGTVTRSKHSAGLLDEKGNPIQTSYSTIYSSSGQLGNTVMNTCETLGQTDRFGRIDTVSNMRIKIDIKPSSVKCANGYPLTPGYSEYYVNWYFPPYNSSAFDVDRIKKAQLAATRAAANQSYKVAAAAAKSEFEKATAVVQDMANLTKGGLLAEDKSLIPTYDPVDMMCSRDGFTYRTAGYKAINDNISFLQHIFEECSGVVSTYLTDWDLSLYIQEGLLTEKASGNIWLCNRIEADNPQGLDGEDAYNWGVINAAVSKLPVNGSSSNLKTWNPQAYYLSSYWWPYSSPDRGDGLGLFWDHASVAINDSRNVELRTTFSGKIKYDDYVHAAYAGWKNFDDMKYYQALYTDPDDGLSVIDIVHAQESNGTGEEPYDSMVHEINAIQDALYSDDDSLGFTGNQVTEYQPGGDVNWKLPGGVFDSPRTLQGCGSYNRLVKHYNFPNPYDSGSRVLDYTDYYYNDQYVGSTDAAGNGTAKDANNVNIDGEGNISVMGVEIPGSSMLKVFLKRNKYKQSALGIASKTKNGFGSFGSAANGNSGSSSSDGSTSALGDLFAPGPDENGRYSNPLGVPRLGPALFGGPHGAFASPQTMQAYFDPDNPFLHSIARINPDIRAKSNNFTSNNKKDYYSGVESSYMYPAGRNELNCYIGRSPSETIHLLTSGVCEIVYGARINVYRQINENIYTDDASVTAYQGSGGYGYGYRSGGSRYIACVTSWHFPSSKRGGTITYSGSEVRSTSVCTKNTGVRAPSNAVITAGAGVRRAYVSNGYIYVEYYKKYKYGSYSCYVSENYNRPLLHCIPFYGKDHVGNANYSRWQIAKYTASISPDVTTANGSFKQFLDAWGAGNRDEVQMCGQYQEMKMITQNTQTSNEHFYRLTMPYYGDSFKSNPMTGKAGWWEAQSVTTAHYNRHPPQPGYHVTWTDRYKPEEEFVSYMLKNAGSPGSNDWTNIFFCYSDPNDSESTRKTVGPRALIQIPCRLQVRTATYNLWAEWCSDYRHKPKCDPCHEDYSSMTNPAILETTYKFIECDVDKTRSFWASANFSEIYTPNLVNRDIMSDIPSSSSHVPVANNVWQQVTKGPAKTKFRFAGMGFYDKDSGGDDGGQYLSGWGMYSALPGFGEIPGQSSFEDANEVLNLSRGSALNKDTPLKDYTFSVPIHRSSGGAYRNADGEYYYNPNEVNYKCTYEKKPMSTYDPGFENFLKKMYTSCTLFTPDVDPKKDKTRKLKDALIPFTTDISNCLISAMKLVEHQRAYLLFGKELFENSVECSEVIHVINRCIDKKITYASIGAHKNENSIYYNYWIDKADQLYSQGDAKTKLSNAFQTRINQIDTFLDKANTFMRATKAETIDAVSAKNWSYNDYLACYNVFDSFKSICNGLDSSIEEYFYSYLNVLYEYRRFYINKRCNKQDGTLWTCRAFESVVPMLNGSASEEKVDMGSMVENASLGESSYSIAMKILSNNIYDKGNAVITNNGLGKDRIKRLLMPCVPATEDDWNKFIKGELKDGREIIHVKKPDPNDKFAFKDAYIEKPVDGTYQLIASEYLSNKQNKDYNELLANMRDNRTITEQVYQSKLRGVNDSIEDCIFPIVWVKSSDSDALKAYLDSANDIKKAAADQTEKKSIYTRLQQEEVALVEQSTKDKQASETVIENWKNTISYANQCITSYYDYADYWFYGDSTKDARFKKLKQMVALTAVIGAKGTNSYDSLKSSYMKEYASQGASALASQLANGLKVLKFNSSSDDGLYDYYATTDANRNNSLSPEENFNANIDELYSWISQYIDAKNNLESYKKSLASAEESDKNLKDKINSDIKDKKSEIAAAKLKYDEATEKFKEEVAKQKLYAEVYNNKRLSKESREIAEKYTWIANVTDSTDTSYHDPNDTLHPNILFNLVSGIDLSKIDPTSKSDPKEVVCGAGNFADYWCITLPNPPVDIGYDTRIKIKTYSTNVHEASAFTANMATTVAGAFAYSLYPITEDQQGAIAAIAADITDAESLIKSTYS